MPVNFTCEVFQYNHRFLRQSYRDNSLSAGLMYEHFEPQEPPEPADRWVIWYAVFWGAVSFSLFVGEIVWGQ